MNRRTFLGAAAALAIPPKEVDGRGATVRSNHGASRKSFPTHTSGWSAIEVPESTDEDTEFGVTGFHYDDEPSQVQLSIKQTHRSVLLNPDPLQARSLANDLLAAARHAEGGSR